MPKGTIVAVSSLALTLLACVTVPFVNAEGYIANWTSPTISNLYSVSMVSADEGWVVGSGGEIIRWNGVSWNTVTSPTTFALYSVSMVSASDGWAASTYATINWNGVSWTTVTIPTYVLFSVSMVGANDGCAVGAGGRIIRWNGTSWKTVTSPTSSELYSVFMVSASDGWAVGDAGTIIRWDGSQWVPEFPSVLIVPPLMTILAVAVYKRKQDVKS